MMHSKIISYFNKASKDYKFWSNSMNMHFGYYSKGMNPFNLESMLTQMNREVLIRLKISKTSASKIADLGCGVGTTSRFIVNERANSSCYGVTISPEQVRIGNCLNKTGEFDKNIKIILSDFTNTPFQNSYFDAVFALESSCYAKGSGKADLIKEMSRILNSGGRFVIADGFRKHTNKLPFFLSKIYQKSLDCWALQELGEINSLIKGLEHAGFVNIRVKNISWNVAVSFVHIPIVVLRYLANHFFYNKKKLHRQSKNNLIAPLCATFLGIRHKHFGYYIIDGYKE